MAEKSLHERFRDFEDRLESFEKKVGPATPEEHDVAQLLNDLRGKRMKMHGYLESNQGDPTGTRGTAATYAGSKDTEGGAAKETAATLANEEEAAAVLRDMEKHLDEAKASWERSS